MFNSLRYTGLSHGLEHILLIPEAALRKLSEMPLLAMGASSGGVTCFASGRGGRGTRLSGEGAVPTLWEN